MYYNHPIHGDPTPEEVEEFRQSCRGGRWTCLSCGRSHSEFHKKCWWCKPTGYINKLKEDIK